MLIRVKESLRLLSAAVVQIGVNTTSLHNVLEIVFGLSVTDEVDFFAGQFCFILGASIANRRQLSVYSVR
jgi:hypothetical protein